MSEKKEPIQFVAFSGDQLAAAMKTMPADSRCQFASGALIAMAEEMKAADPARALRLQELAEILWAPSTAYMKSRRPTPDA